MESQFTLDEFKARGSGRPAPDGVVRLYRQAFADYGARALWNWRRDIERRSIT